MKGAGDCTDCEPDPQGPSGTRRADIRGRFPVEQPWPDAGPTRTFARAMERNWDVDVLTGQPHSTVRQGQWGRGQVVRAFQPTVQLPTYHPMFDRTHPASWHQAQR